jgi:hypothetical protein
LEKNWRNYFFAGPFSGGILAVDILLPDKLYAAERYAKIPQLPDL